LNERVSTQVAVLLAVAAAAIAIVGTRAALLSGSGQELAHQSLREDVQRSAAIVEDVRAVYQDEFFFALQIAQARIHGLELRREARRMPAEIRTMLRAQGLTEGVAAAVSLERMPLTSQRRYEIGFAEYDLAQRLADLRAEHPRLVALDPDETNELGREDDETASLLVGTTVLLALGFLCGALAHGFPRLRTSFLGVGYGCVGIGLCAALLAELST
jgi:hypothetical protein